MILFHGVRKSVPKLKPSPNRTSIGFTRIAFPTTILPECDRSYFVQEEPRHLQCLTMTFAIYVVEDGSKKNGHSDFGILSILHPHSSVSGYCVGSVSCTIRWSCNDRVWSSGSGTAHGRRPSTRPSFHPF